MADRNFNAEYVQPEFVFEILHLNAEDAREKVIFPPGFVEAYLPDPIPENAVIETVEGELFNVKVSKEQNKWVINEGWAECFIGNTIQYKESLMFTYMGNMRFTVHVICICTREIDELRRARSIGACPRCLTLRLVQDGRGWKDWTIFESNNSIFRRQMTPSCVKRPFLMSIPRDFARSLPPDATMFRLKNLYDAGWNVKCLNKCKTQAFSAGWAKFVEDNEIAELDVCIFERIGPRSFKVHLFKQPVNYFMSD